jgi:DNA-directed RNA polymerase specialized sigma24 family protein
MKRLIRKGMCDPHTADDIAQDAAVIVWQKIASGKFDATRGPVQALLYGVIKKKLQRVRKKEKSPVPLNQIGDVADGSLGPAEIVELEDLYRKLKERLLDLKSEQLAALNQHFKADLFGLAVPASFHEHVLPNARHGRKFRAMKRLRRDFEAELAYNGD